MATVKENLEKTKFRSTEIISLAQQLGVSVIFGGTGLQFLPSIVASVDTTFVKYSDLRQLIS
jgi:hypothetical protein